MNPYYDLTDGFTLAGLSGGTTELKGFESASSPLMTSDYDLDLRQMSPTENIMYNAGRYTDTSAGKGPEVKAGAQGTGMPKNVYAEDVMQSLSANNSLPSKHTEEQIKMYTAGASYGVKALSYFANALVVGGVYDMKKRQYEFLANQDDRAAELLYKNMKEITRAAQADANVYKMQGASVKSKQKTAQSASGFAVGKGVYKNTLDTTDARTNYNVSLVMLKSDLQNAEMIRKAGTYEAKAAIERGNAKIAKIEKEAAITTNVIKGIGAVINSGISFYVGGWGLEGGSSKTVTKTTGPDGNSSWAVNGKAMYGTKQE